VQIHEKGLAKERILLTGQLHRPIDDLNNPPFRCAKAEKLLLLHQHDRSDAEDIQDQNPSQPAEPDPNRAARTSLRLIPSFAVHAASLGGPPVRHN